jgi:hypothetical protein
MLEFAKGNTFRPPSGLAPRSQCARVTSTPGTSVPIGQCRYAPSRNEAGIDQRAGTANPEAGRDSDATERLRSASDDL